MSRSALNEKGVNTLFLAIGFVEWVESENSDEKILSPLLLLPIEISEKKTKKGTEFSISGTDSDVQINIALKAKFEKDFGIILPDLEEEETGSYEASREMRNLIKNIDTLLSSIEGIATSNNLNLD